MDYEIEKLENLERRVTISLPVDHLNLEVDKRLRIKAKKLKLPGFRPGKVPIKMVLAQFGEEIEKEVLNEQLTKKFREITKKNDVKVAGFPTIRSEENSKLEGFVVFNATFEIYPEIQIGDLSKIIIEKPKTTVSNNEIDKTIEILRNQRAVFKEKVPLKNEEMKDAKKNIAEMKDRITLNFEGKLDGKVLDKASAKNFSFIIGEGKMLGDFETATLKMKIGESKTFSMKFPEEYPNKEISGKNVEFTIEIIKIEYPILPEIDKDFAVSLGIKDGNLNKMREDVQLNLEYEVSNRLKKKIKTQVMDALLETSVFDVPKSLIEEDTERLKFLTKSDLNKKGMDSSKISEDTEIFRSRANRRVRLSLIFSEIVKLNSLGAKKKQIDNYINDLAKTYEDPQKILKYYYNDQQRLSEIESLVVEENVVNFVLENVIIKEVSTSFEDLMKSY